MDNQQLLDYIKQQIAEGITDEDIKKALLQNGWSDADIDGALSTLRAPTPTLSASMQLSSTVWIISVVVLILVVGGGVLAYVLVTEKSVTVEAEPIIDISATTGDVTIEDPTIVTGEVAGVEVDWGGFRKTNHKLFGDRWEKEIEISNSQNKMIVIDAVGESRNYNWTWGVEKIVRSKDSETISLTINHDVSKEPKFDKKKMIIYVYECNKLKQSTVDELCLENFGFDGILSPWETLEKYKEAGTPIQPTSVYTKYYNFNSLESPPSEISEVEYLN